MARKDAWRMLGAMTPPPQSHSLLHVAATAAAAAKAKAQWQQREVGKGSVAQADGGDENDLKSRQMQTEGNALHSKA